MKTIGADYNAMTESGHVRLTLPCSQEGFSRLGLRAGDWAWLSDGEVIVGANWPSMIATDSSVSLTGRRIVPLDEDGADDFDRIRAALNLLETREPPSTQDEPRVLQLITQLEYAAPPHIREASGWTFGFRRALALRQMGKLGLALLEAEEARQAPLPTTQKSGSSTSISSGGRNSPPPSCKPRPWPNCRTCRPSSCRRASTSSRPRRSRRPTTSSSRSPAASSPGVSGSIRPRISIEWGRRSWPCLSSTGIRAPSRGPDLWARQAFETRPADLSRRPDARRGHRAPDL